MKYEWTSGATTFKRRLIHLMEEKGLSQQAVADFAGVSQQTISRWLAGSNPVLENVTSLAAKAGVPVSWLAHGEGKLKIVYGGVDGFIHRAKSRVIPRLVEVAEKFCELQEEDFLSEEEREIVLELEGKLNKRRVRLSQCIAALENLPPSEHAVVNEILSKYNPTPAEMMRLEICWLLGLLVKASDDEILEACRAVLKKNPRPKVTSRKSDIKSKSKS